MHEAIALLQQLVRIPSVSPHLDPATGQGEQAIAEFAAAWLNERGVESWLEAAAPGRPNVVGKVGSGSGPVLVLCGHLDTVQATGMTIDPFGGEIRDGRLYGRGAYDMKAGVAAIMTAAAELARTNTLKGTLLLALVSDEEYASVGAQDFVRRHQADGCLLAEPTDGAFVTGHRGFAWVDVTVQGRAAHGSRWDLGISANTMAGRLLTALDHHDLTVLRPRKHPLLGPASVHPAIVRGGVGLSTYAPECLLQLEWRILPGTTEADVLTWTNDLVQHAGITAAVTCTLFRPPMLCPAAARMRQATLEAIGQALPEQGAPFWMDAAFFDAAGIPTVVYGPTGEGAHAAVEWVDLASVIHCTEVYGRTAALFCS
ncbi:MAG: hypothetical protein JWN15_2332 [Firmicutes bacterium]|nr:hypothetical protein [Bacillota bacterium]